jgi:hypothetical protein
MNNSLGGRFNKRSFSLKILAVGWLVIAIFSCLRFYQALSYWDTLLAFGEPVLPLSMAVSGALWAVVGFICSCGVWLKRVWSAWLSFYSAVAFSVWRWLDWSLLTRSQAAQTNLSFALISTIVLLFIVGGILTLNLRNNREGAEYGARN